MMPAKEPIESSEIPESDLLDQTTPIDPNDTVEELGGNQVARDFVNEADWIDQQIPVPVDDTEREEI